MTGKSFKQGYTCQICIDNRWRPEKQEALYKRSKEGFKFIGKVLCAFHGIQDAVKISDVR